MTYLVGEGLTGGYGSGPSILNGCNISVDRGEIAVIVGPNGAGKSTAMKSFLGLLNLKEGKVTLDGKDITHLEPPARISEGIAFVPQTENVFVSMTVEENLEMGAFLRDDDFTDTRDQIYDLFPILKEKRFQLAGQLSGGQRQRTALARALSHKPRILLLDEPLGALDALTRLDMQALIEKLWREQGFTAILVTHDVSEAVQLADRIILLDKGHIAQQFKVDLARPRKKDYAFSELEQQVLNAVLAT